MKKKFVSLVIFLLFSSCVFRLCNDAFNAPYKRRKKGNSTRLVCFQFESFHGAQLLLESQLNLTANFPLESIRTKMLISSSETEFPHLSSHLTTLVSIVVIIVGKIISVSMLYNIVSSIVYLKRLEL